MCLRYQPPSGYVPRLFIIAWLMMGLLIFPACTSIELGPSWENIPQEVSRRVPPLPPSEAKGKIQPGETIIITVWEHPELSRERTVSPEGFLQLPLFGNLKVSGLTPAELEKILAHEMVPYIKNPLIWVERKVELTQNITVLGAVARPGTYTFPKTQEVKLLTLLAVAGGYTEGANLEQVRIFRDNPTKEGRPSRQGILVNLREILASPLAQDATLQDNDAVFLEQTEGSKWNVGIQKITPTLQVIALTLGIIWVFNQMRDNN